MNRTGAANIGNQTATRGSRQKFKTVKPIASVTYIATPPLFKFKETDFFTNYRTLNLSISWSLVHTEMSQ